MRFVIFLFAAALATPALADPTPPAMERKLVIYGNDPCPRDTICVVAPENERYRIPRVFRRGPASPDNQSWAVRSRDTLNLGKTGIGSCSPSGGAAGWTGCFQKQMEEYRREAEEDKANARKEP